MATICIFTPTYNRAYTLGRLYRSLVGQTNHDFTWLVVDDGSTDGTEELIGSFAEDGLIDIVYRRTDNGGKQRAMNLGVDLCKDELFYCLDSDDYLVPDAVARAIEAWTDVRNEKNVAGIVALRGSDANTPMRTFMPRGVRRTTLWDLYNCHGFKGDVALLHRTEILRAFPYEVDEREKFISESTVYYAIDDFYELSVLDRVLTICKYLEDGYTSHVRELAKDNPAGYMKFHLDCIGRSRTLYQRWYHSSLYLVGCELAKKRYGGIENGKARLGRGLIPRLSQLTAWVLLKTEFR